MFSGGKVCHRGADGKDASSDTFFFPPCILASVDKQMTNITISYKILNACQIMKIY